MFDFIKSIFNGGEQVDLAELIKNKAFLVDVRTPAEFKDGHPKGAVNVPLDKVQSSLSTFKNKENIIVFCRSGNRSSQAKSILEANGITNVVNGGTWQNVNSFL